MPETPTRWPPLAYSLKNTMTLHSEVTRALLPILGAKGPRRLIAVTGYGAGDSREAMSVAERSAHRLLLGRPYADKDRQEALIRASDLDWTLVRPVLLRESPGRGAYRVLTATPGTPRLRWRRS